MPREEELVAGVGTEKRFPDRADAFGRRVGTEKAFPS